MIPGQRMILAGLVLGSMVLVTACGSTAAPGAGGAHEAAGDKPAAEAKGFTEYPIGDEQQAEGMNVALVYFQPVPLAPEGKAGPGPKDADLHLEADISALPENPLGFGVGEWVPNLQVGYSVKHEESGKVLEGNFMPMNAADGPHYGANVKMPAGAGKYRITLQIKAPVSHLLHTDAETGVNGQWWDKARELQWDFQYVPRKW